MIQGFLYNIWKLGKQSDSSGLWDLWLFRPTQHTARCQKIHGVHWSGCWRAPMDVLKMSLGSLQPLETKNCSDPNGDLGSRKAYIWNKCMITVHHHSPKNAIMVDFWYETPVTLTYKKAISKRKQVFQNPDFLQIRPSPLTIAIQWYHLTSHGEVPRCELHCNSPKTLGEPMYQCFSIVKNLK